MKKMKMIRGMIVIVISLSICGCSSNNEVSTSTNYEETETREEKIYTLRTEDKDKGKVEPEIRLSENDKTFSFIYDTLSSYLPYGEYSEGEYTDKIYLKTSDGKYEYVFDRVDDDTLQFDKEHSSSLDIIDENITPRLEDGAEFVHE